MGIYANLMISAKKRSFSFRFLDLPGALRTVWKRAKKAEKGCKSLISADLQEGRPDTPQAPICYTPICGSPKNIVQKTIQHYNTPAEQ